MRLGGTQAIRPCSRSAPRTDTDRSVVCDVPRTLDLGCFQLCTRGDVVCCLSFVCLMDEKGRVLVFVSPHLHLTLEVDWGDLVACQLHVSPGKPGRELTLAV